MMVQWFFLWWLHGWAWPHLDPGRLHCFFPRPHTAIRPAARQHPEKNTIRHVVFCSEIFMSSYLKAPKTIEDQVLARPKLATFGMI